MLAVEGKTKNKSDRNKSGQLGRKLGADSRDPRKL